VADRFRAMGYGIVLLSVKTTGSVSCQDSAKQKVSPMASPFTFFRKYQQSLMVVMVIVAMLIFTMDSAFTSRDNQFVLLGVLIGGAMFGAAGINTGRWLKFGIGGAVFGALLGWVMPTFISAPNTEIVSTSLGVFDRKRLVELSTRRSLANAFMFRATESAFGEGTGRFATTFGFGHNSENEDLIFSELMRAEASELGIAVSDDAVSAFINSVTGEKLSRQKYAEARSALMYEGKPLRDEQLYDILRGEISARLAYLSLRPESSALPPTPEYLFSVFRRTNVSQRLNTAKISVDAFLDQVAEPTESEIVTAFEAGRLDFPYRDGPDTLGFRQFPKVRLAALELDYRNVESSVAAATDEEVDAYYNENKETLFRRAVAPTTPDPGNSDTPAADPESAEDGADSGAKQSPESTETPEASGEQPKDGDSPVPDDTAADPEKPSTASESGDATPESADAGKKPEGGDSPSESGNGEPSPSEPDGCFDESAVSQTESDGDETKPEEKQGSTGSESAAPTAADPPAVAIPDAEEKKPEQAATATPGLSISEQENPFPEPQYEYIPLDDDLRNSIRDQLLSAKVKAEIESRMTAVTNDLTSLESQRRDFRFAWFKENPNAESEDVASKMSEFDTTMLDGIKKTGKDLDCAYVETGWLTFDELSDAEEYPLGAATAPASDPFAQAGPTVAQTVFSSAIDETRFFSSRHFVSNSFDPDSGEKHFAWWIIGYSPSHVPTLDEPGVRDEVVLQLKRAKAKTLAKARADDLVAEITAGLDKPDEERTDMATTLEGETVTGQDDSPTLVVRQTLTFSWMQQQATSQFNFMQPPQAQLSTIEFGDGRGDTIRYAGNDFMKAVFEDMSDSDVGVVPDQLHQNYFVVQVRNRSSTPEVGEEALRERFLSERRNPQLNRSPADSIAQSEIGGHVSLEWEKQVWLKYGVDPDAPPPQG
jgi:hypothetical protein